MLFAQEQRDAVSDPAELSSLKQLVVVVLVLDADRSFQRSSCANGHAGFFLPKPVHRKSAKGQEASLTVAEEHSPEPAVDSRVFHRSKSESPFLDTPQCLEESTAPDSASAGGRLAFSAVRSDSLHQRIPERFKCGSTPP
ncbi:hypothetical protein DPX16_11630 [Anabarilius grahami]|uniref:Uncharacterized protein n=1 Tax=Anabarilius grahami TaxID=495550 RepID=A0A3N0Z4U2_ANAGA|nr:hypothetical protein DPX16_11630 [Anabarilius grahami]